MKKMARTARGNTTRQRRWFRTHLWIDSIGVIASVMGVVVVTYTDFKIRNLNVEKTLEEKIHILTSSLNDSAKLRQLSL
jgi:hypothetical protein